MLISTASDPLQASFTLPDCTIDTAAVLILCHIPRFRFFAYLLRHFWMKEGLAMINEGGRYKGKSIQQMMAFPKASRISSHLSPLIQRLRTRFKRLPTSLLPVL
jgi:hypothetical protein